MDGNTSHPEHDQVIDDATYLCCGVDSLDLSFYVEWNNDWRELAKRLEKGKAQAAGTDGILFQDDNCLILPSGRRPNFRWHLKWAQFDMFIGKSQTPQKSAPNVYVSLSSASLWHLGVMGAVDAVVSKIEAYGGKVVRIKPSRCDLAADFHIPNGLTLDFLLKHRVPRHIKTNHYMDGDNLESFYFGSFQSPVQLRLYDKAVEIKTKSGKFWFMDIWRIDDCQDVWRVEFQLRRPALKEMSVETLDDLQSKRGGIWKYLTTDWFTLRLQDNPNTSRRTVHSFWQEVQEVAPYFGEAMTIHRTHSDSTINSEWYVSHISGCLPGYAVSSGVSGFDETLTDLTKQMRAYWKTRNFDERCQVKSIQSGQEPLKGAA